MGRMIVTENMSLDGVIEATGGWFSPAGAEAEADTTDIESALREQMEAEEALLLGRITFESFRGYWPDRTDDSTGIAAHLNAVPKYVVSSTLEDPQWDNTTVLGRDVTEDVRALREGIAGNIGVTGSIMLVHHLIAKDLVDEFRLFVYPVVVGRGRRLFMDASSVSKLSLVEARPFRTGVVLLSYR